MSTMMGSLDCMGSSSDVPKSGMDIFSSLRLRIIIVRVPCVPLHVNGFHWLLPSVCKQKARAHRQHFLCSFRFGPPFILKIRSFHNVGTRFRL